MESEVKYTEMLGSMTVSIMVIVLELENMDWIYLA